ncbi:hypothetical protein C0J52_16598 [Blattella germanica]|nr:hypothetical protein C0J52_16598 [Blattella germanica]
MQWCPVTIHLPQLELTRMFSNISEVKRGMIVGMWRVNMNSTDITLEIFLTSD